MWPEGPLLLLSAPYDIKHWFYKKCELFLIPVLLEEKRPAWTTMRSGLTGTLISFHQLVGIPASLWWLWSVRFLQDKAFAPKLLSMNQATNLQFNMAQEKRRTRLSDFNFTFHFSLSCIGEGNGNPLQCSCLENPKDRGAWWAAVYGVAQSQTRLKRLSSSSKKRKYPT